MSIVSFTLLGQNISLTADQLLDLGRADQDLNLITKETGILTNSLHALQDGSLVSLALNAVNPKWTLGSVNFSLKPTASFSISLQSSGPLLKYFTDFDQSDASNQDTINPAPGKVYLIVEADFGISGDVSGSGTIPTGVGVFKVSGDASAAATYTIRLFKAFDPATIARDAIIDALKGFSLPLHSETARNLQSGDALYYEFDGNVKVGFGASYGISTSVAAQSLSGISQAMSTISKAANLTGPGETFNAQASLAINANLARKFHCILQKTGDFAILHLFKGTDSDFTEGLAASAGISNVSAPSITLSPVDLANDIVAKLPATAGQVVQLAESQTASLQQAATDYINQANNWLKSLSQKVNNNGQVSLSLQFEQADTNARAFGWAFDTTKANFGAVWNLAMSCDFVAAYAQGKATGTATLLDGSGFETTFKRNTQVKLSFFGLGGAFTSLSSYYGATTVTFKQGMFCFETNAGRMQVVQSGNGKFSSTMYLDCLANNTSGNDTVNSADLTLHGILSCSKEPTTLANFGSMLHAIGIELNMASTEGGAEILTLGDIFRNNAAEQNSTGEGLVHLIYTMDAVKRIRSDAYNSNRKQLPRPHLLDQQNWNAFSDAFQTLPSDLETVINSGVSPIQYLSFRSWEFFNCYVNGLTIEPEHTPNSQMTDRRHTGVITDDAISHALTPDGDGTLPIGFSLQVKLDLGAYYSAGQQYMNLCDDIKAAATVLSGPNIDWPSIIKSLNNIAKQDISPVYAPQVLLALIQSTQATSVQVVSSMTNQDQGDGSVIIQVM